MVTDQRQEFATLRLSFLQTLFKTLLRRSHTLLQVANTCPLFLMSEREPSSFMSSVARLLVVYGSVLTDCCDYRAGKEVMLLLFADIPVLCVACLVRFCSLLPHFPSTWTHVGVVNG